MMILVVVAARSRQRLVVAATIIGALCSSVTSFCLNLPFHASINKFDSHVVTAKRRAYVVPTTLFSTTDESASASSSSSSTAAPILNGKRVLPYKIMMTGLQSHRVAGVFAVLDSSYKRGTEGWEACTYVGVSQDLGSAIQWLHENDVTQLKVAHIRALSFSFPEPNAMQQIADDWRRQATEARAPLDGRWADDVLNYLFDDDDDDDDDDDEFEIDDIPDSAATIVSPFDSSKGIATEIESSDDVPLVFNPENIDKVLDEVRPYLIADGGNVAIERVDEESRSVYLQLEGACGSCASSTVTMQMGIERVIKEKFGEVNIFRTEEDPEAQPKELTFKAVEDEVNRLRPAIIAMGGAISIESIDVPTGTVNIKFQGAEKVKNGLELALLDVAFVEKVNFVA
jgi:Fe-S cluster biogenesis protein NfuA